MPAYKHSSFDSGNFIERSVAFTVGRDFVNMDGNLLGVAVSYEHSSIRSHTTGVRGSSDDFSLSGYGSKRFDWNKSVDFSLSLQRGLNDRERHISLNDSVAYSKYSNYYTELDVVGNIYEDCGPVVLKFSGGFTLSGGHYNAINESGEGDLNLHIFDHGYVRIMPKIQTDISTGSFEYGPLIISPSVVLGAEVALSSRDGGVIDSHFLRAPDLNLPIPLDLPGRRGYKFGFESTIKHMGYRDRFNVLFMHEKRSNLSVNSLRLYHTVKF